MSKTATSGSQPEQKNAGSNLPLFYKNPVPLDPVHHAKAGFQLANDFSFAARTNSILINIVEFFEASKQYPIVFTMSETPLPVAIVGMEEQNYFVDSKGLWKENVYIPAYVRKYPFAFMNSTKNNEFILCVDEASTQFKANGGKDTMPLFDGKDPAELTKTALEFCGAFQSEIQATELFCKTLKSEGLLTPMRSDYKLENGREIGLAGFEVIDEQKLQALPDAKILELFKKGWLPAMYASLMSGSNWRHIADMASVVEKAKAS